MIRLTKYENDLIRNKAINILRNLSDKNKLSGDELSIIGAFLILERAENTKLAKYEGTKLEPEDVPGVKNLAIQYLKETIKKNEVSMQIGRVEGIDVTPIREANEDMDKLLLKLVADVQVNCNLEDKHNKSGGHPPR